MKNMLFPIGQSTSRLFLGGVAVLWLVVSPALQAQTNFNFNNTNAPTSVNTDPGWQHWTPDFYWDFGTGSTGMIQPTVTFTTNNSSADNFGYYFRAGTTNLTLNNFFSVFGTALDVQAGSFITNGPVLTNFTMTGECFRWTNGQSQGFGIVGRVQLPLPDPNVPGLNSTTNTARPSGLMLIYENARSSKAFRNPAASGSTDNMRLVWLANNGYAQLGNNGAFSGPTNGLSSPVYTPDTSLSPDPTNGHYRMVLTVNSNDCTGQIVDLSTGLPMRFSGPTSTTNIIRASFMNAVASTPALASFINVGGTYGFFATLGSSGATTYIPEDATQGQPIDPHFDNFAIVPGVVTLETAAVVEGPYTVDTSAGIEVNPKRITVPLNGSRQFYRINLLGVPGDNPRPVITSIAPGPAVNQVLVSSTTATTTNAVRTMVLTYE